jgi:hypothetical protein
MNIVGASYDCNGDEISTPGLYVEPGTWRYTVFQCRGTEINSHGSRRET